MKTFIEFLQHNEAMSMSTRMKMRKAARKNKAKMAAGKRRAAKKASSPEKLKKKANKAARLVLTKKILKGKSKDDLSFSAKADLEKKLDKKKAAIKRIAKKLLPQIKKADIARLKRQKDKD